MIQKSTTQPISYIDLLLLLIWFAIGLILRFTNLGDKPASSIEIATLGFSLGHGFTQIPLDRLISASTLLAPLKLDLAIDYGDVVNRLFAESTHPPLYFWLTHWWIKLFVDRGDLVSLQVGRALSAILGALTIPAIFGLSWITFKNRLTAHLTAILMAVSPYGIYLAQEARHYTLSILWIIASLSCAILAIQFINRRCKVPWWICLVWIVVNSLGIATHYFFSLALALEGFICLGFWFWQHRQAEKKSSLNYWLPVIITGLGTLIGCLVWIPVTTGISSSELTDWIATSYDLDEIWQPIPRLLVWLITMIVMLPIEGVAIAIAVCSGIIILFFLIGIMPELIKGGKLLFDSSQNLAFKLLLGYFLGAIALYFALIYGYGKDISLAARYHFVYFPAVILILSAILAQLWHIFPEKTAKGHQWFYLKGKQVLIAILIMGFLGSLTVTNDLGYKKSRHANRLAEHIQTQSNVPAIVATTYESLAELRELVALALAVEIKSVENEDVTTQFLLVQRNENHDSNLNAIISSQPKPLDLWGVNLRANETKLEQLNCLKDDDARLSDSGYKNRVYHCY